MTFHDAEPSVLWRAVYDRNLAKTQQALSTEDVKLINQPYGMWQNTCLHYAAKNGDLFIVRFLLKEKATKVNAVNINGTTPLHFAVEMDHEPIVKELLASGARYDKRNYRGETAIDVATRLNRIRIRSMLLMKNESK